MILHRAVVDLSDVHDGYNMARDCGLGPVVRRAARMTPARRAVLREVRPCPTHRERY